MTEIPKRHESTPQERDPLLRGTYDAVCKQSIRLTKTARGRPLYAGDRSARFIRTDVSHIPKELPIGKIFPFSFPVEDIPLISKGCIIVLSEVPSPEDELVNILLETIPKDKSQQQFYLGRHVEITRDGLIGVRVPVYEGLPNEPLHTMLWEETEKWGLPSNPQLDVHNPYAEDDPLEKILFTNTQGKKLLTKLHELEELTSSESTE